MNYRQIDSYALSAKAPISLHRAYFLSQRVTKLMELSLRAALLL